MYSIFPQLTWRRLQFILLTASTLLVVAADRPAAVDSDSDGDGLPDFQEIHKYFTDPHRADTAGNGVKDGDWQERREHTYSIRSIVRIMPPYSRNALNDDYQDVRIRAETKDYIELEVISYPLNTNADQIPANPSWKKDYASMKEYLQPGITANWDVAMRQQLLKELAADRIDPDRMTDKEVVEQVSRWLFRRTKQKNMFCTNYIHFPNGRPAVFQGLEAAFERDKGDSSWSAQEQFEHEILAKDMFQSKSCGTCTSAANFQAAVLRCLGIPVRIILTIPMVDASDPDQVALVRNNLTNQKVQRTVEAGLRRAGNNYANHTYLEVMVGNRWRRLNYTTLGQNILDANCLGLMIHVHTFQDLSEANLAPTWGARYALGQKNDSFQHQNPYRTLEVSDYVGRYANLANESVKEHRRLTLSRAYWRDSPDAPDLVKAMPERSGFVNLFAHVEEWLADADDAARQYTPFIQRADKSILLRASGHPDITGAVIGSVTHPSTGVHEVVIALPKHEYARMASEVDYRIEPANSVAHYQWHVGKGLTIRRLPSALDKMELLEKQIQGLERRIEVLEKQIPK